MREEIRLEIARRTAEKFVQARGESPQPVKQIGEAEWVAKSKKYADLLIEAALNQVR